MKEEIKRIMKLVQEGKLSPEDAAELIDAFSSAGDEPAAGTTGTVGTSENNGSEKKTGEAPPPPPGDASPPPPPGTNQDPLKGFVDWIESVSKDVKTKVDWQDVAKHVRIGTERGVENLRTGIGRLRKANFNFPWFGTYETREILLPLRVPEGKTLRIENPCGDVRISGGQPQGQINATVRIKGADEAEARENADSFSLLLEETDHEVVLRQHDIPGIDMDLDVRIQGGAALDIKFNTGDLTISNTGASAKIEGSSGDISVSGLNGTIDINNASGNIRVTDSKTQALAIEGKSGDLLLSRIEGNINARTASGNVTLRECSGKTISVESVSGDVHVDLPEPITGNVNVRTVNGDTAVAIADGSDCRVSLSTLRGDVNCDVVLEDEAKMDQHITGRLGKGSGTLDVSAVNGDITMQIREHMATAAD